MNLSKRSLYQLIAGLALLLAALPVVAHHSFTMFDNSKQIVITGVIKEFQWTNPHMWVQLMVKDPATGKEVEWSIEGGSPNGMRRQGWARTSIKPGDTASVVIHPLKDGGPGGSLISVSVNGQPVGRGQPE